MPEIPFTQFLRPEGKPTLTYIDVPLEIELLAVRFIEEGGRFTSELLRDNVTVSLCAEFTIDGELQDIASTLAPNGPPVVEAVHQLVREAYVWLQKTQYDEMKGPPL